MLSPATLNQTESRKEEGGSGGIDGADEHTGEGTSVDASSIREIRCRSYVTGRDFASSVDECC